MAPASARLDTPMLRLAGYEAARTGRAAGASPRRLAVAGVDPRAHVNYADLVCCGRVLQRWVCGVGSWRVGARVSLERQSRDAGSTLCQFLDHWLPRRGAIVERWQQQLCAPLRVPNSLRCDRAAVGKALEARIGLDLADEPGCLDLLGFLPAPACLAVLGGCGFSVRDLTHLPDTQTVDPVLQTWTRTARPSRVDEVELAALRYLLDVMGMEQVSPRFEDRRSVQLCRALFLAIYEHSRPRSVGDPDLLVLRHDWEGYLQHGRALLRTLGDRVIVSPVLAPGFATADLVVGLTLVEIKNYLDPAPRLQCWLDQVLGYMLLDRWNTLHLSQVAVYCAGQASLLVEPIDKILRVSATDTPPLIHELRAAFHEAMRSELEDAARWRQSRLFPMPREALSPSQTP